MTDESDADYQEKNRQMLVLYRAELDKRELANTDNYDKNILTLSSAGLATSLTLIKGMVENPSGILFLCASWLCFGLAILTTISSFLVSNKALKRQLEIAEKYYIEDDDEAFHLKNKWSDWLSKINLMSGLFFSLAIVSIIVFGLLNFEGKSVTENKQNADRMQDINEGQYVSKMQKKDVEKGATVPPVTKKPENTQQPKKTNK